MIGIFIKECFYYLAINIIGSIFFPYQGYGYKLQNPHCISQNYLEKQNQLHMCIITKGSLLDWTVGG